METTQTPTKEPIQNSKSSSLCLSLKLVSAASLPAGCPPPHAHSTCQGKPCFCECLWRDNTLLAAVPKVSVMSGPWICPFSLRTCFVQVYKVPAAVILPSFQWETGSLICLNVKEITELSSLPVRLLFSCRSPFVTGWWFVLKHPHSHRPIFPGAPASFCPFPLQLLLQPLLLCRFLDSCFPGPWPRAIHISSFRSLLGLVFPFSLLLFLTILSPQAFPWTSNNAAAGKNMLTRLKNFCSDICSKGTVGMT